MCKYIDWILLPTYISNNCAPTTLIFKLLNYSNIPLFFF